MISRHPLNPKKRIFEFFNKSFLIHSRRVSSFQFLNGRERKRKKKRERERSILIIFHFENPIGLERKRYLSLSLALSKSRAHVSHHLTSYVKLNELKLSRHFLNNGFKLYKKNILPQQKCSNSRSLSV